MADFEVPQQQQELPPQQQKSSEKQPPPPPPDYLLHTLDESVGTTLWRDFKLILIRTWQVIWIFNKSQNLEVYEQYDLFGPFFYGLVFSIFIELASSVQNMTVVAMSVIFLGALVVAVNVSLLGGKASIMGTVCLLGYCIAPLSVIAFVIFILTLFPDVKNSWFFGLITAILAALGAIWGLFAAWGFFRNVLVEGKRFQSVYPVIFLFTVLGMFVVFGLA